MILPYSPCLMVLRLNRNNHPLSLHRLLVLVLVLNDHASPTYTQIHALSEEFIATVGKWPHRASWSFDDIPLYPSTSAQGHVLHRITTPTNCDEHIGETCSDFQKAHSSFLLATSFNQTDPFPLG
jgi:hypothetical protein